MKKLLMIVPLVILLCFAFGCQEQAIEEAPEGISEEEAQRIAEQMLEIFNEGNLAIVDEIFDPGFVRHDRALPEDIVGIDAFKAYVTSLRAAYPDFAATIDEQIVKGDKMITRWTVTGTNTGPLQTAMGEFPPTGKAMSVNGAEIITVVNGKITEDWIFYNQLDALLQLGYTLTPPQPPEEK